MSLFRNISSYLALICLIMAFGCTDVITVETEEVPEQIVVDAWLNNLPVTQTIRLTLSKPYFDNSIAQGIMDASVSVISDAGPVIQFESQGNGDYTWMPQPGQTLGQVGDGFGLQIEWDGRTFGALSEMHRVPEIDSIVSEFRESELGLPEGMYAEFFARDFVGVGDTYWIKTYKNGEYLNKGFEINLAYDAGFDPGSQIDGLVFIPPIRDLINRIPDDDSDSPDNFDVPPYALGDNIRVEIHSMTQEAFAFMEIARDQINNGANTIFALPLSNVRSNIIDIDSEESVLGFFCVSAVSVSEAVVE